LTWGGKKGEERRSSISSVIDIFFLPAAAGGSLRIAIEKKMCAGQAVERGREDKAPKERHEFATRRGPPAATQ